MRLIESLATTEPLAALFSDESLLRAMLEFEVALARAEARHKLIPHAAAEAIAAAAADLRAFDVDALSRSTVRAGTPGIPLAKALRAAVGARQPAAADFVHWGATSQDVADTAFVLLLKRAQPLIEGDLIRAERALGQLAQQHRRTAMLGRTLLQPAPPITFALKAAGWKAAIARSRQRLKHTFREALILQFGGASGTLAALGNQGLKVARAIADQLGLRCPEAPWHTHRDRLAALVSACGILTGSLGKIARDISLLMQSEVGEAAEPGGTGRGGSSTMPHKRNPIGCALALAAAHRTPGLVASYLTAMVQEHERAVGAWQSEWPTLASLIQATGAAALAVAEIAKGLSVDSGQMAVNLEKTQGTIFAEKAMFLLAEKLGRENAYRILESASRRAMAEKQPLVGILGAMPEVTAHFDPPALEKLTRPEEYLGITDSLTNQLLEESGSNEEKD